MRLTPLIRGGVLLALALALLLVPAAFAQQRQVSLIFSGDLLSQIATDNQGEQTAEIVDRIIGLSPTILNARLQRSSGRVILHLSASGAEDVPVQFQFTLDKMVYYRMRTARADITGMTEALQEAKAAEPLLREVGYRFDGRYSIIDLTLDMRAAAKASREIQERRATEAQLAEDKAAAEAKAAEAKTAADAKSAGEAKAAADAKAAAEAKAAAQAQAAEARAAAEAARAAAAKAATEEKARAAAKEPAPPAARDTPNLAAKAIGRAAPPVLDGLASDPAWQDVPRLAVEVQGASGKMSVTVAALWSPERLWFIVRWPDKSRDAVHRPWVWSGDEKAYVAGREVEDAVSLAFARDGRMGECMLAGAEAVTDLWTWRAGRTDPSGYAEDATMTVTFQRIARANSYPTHNGRSVWIKEEPDTGALPYQAQVAGAYTGDRIARYIARTPSGSMADVTAKGSWKDGFWTVEFSRRLSTGDPGDVGFAQGRDTYVSLAIFNSREGTDHSTSKELALRLE